MKGGGLPVLPSDHQLIQDLHSEPAITAK